VIARELRSSLIALSCATAVVSAAGSLEAKEIHVPAGDLGAALETLAKQSGAEVVYRAEQVKGIHTKGVDGDVSPEQAVKQLLTGTQLGVHTDSSGAMLIFGDAPLADVPIKETEAGESRGREDEAKKYGVVALVTEEIIVSARKRQETVFRVPVVVTAIGQQALEKAQVHDLYSLSPQVPSLFIGTQTGVIGPGVTLRGVGSTATNPTIDQSISLNVDGLQLSQGFAYLAAMFDVGQVEVLRGPQALFYGKNSPAGVVSLRSADPTDKTEVILRTGYEAVAVERFGEAVLSGPVSDTLKLRLGVRYSDSDGYFQNLATAPVGYGVRSPTTKDVGGVRSWVVRGTALFRPSDAYDARLKMNYVNDFQNNGGGDSQYTYCPGGLISFTGLPVFDPKEDCTLNRNLYVSWADRSGYPMLRNDGVPFMKSHSEFGTLEQNLHFGDLTVTSVTGLYVYHHQALVSGAATSGVSPFFADNDFFNRQFTQETRLTSNFADRPVNFMVGSFYQDGRMKNVPRLYGDIAIPGLPLPPILRYSIHTVDIESVSAFGQVLWDMTDHVEFSAGARWTHETRDHTQTNVSTPNVPPGPVIAPDPHLKSDNVSPEVTISYRPSANVTFFGSYKQGFKSGSFNTVTYIPAGTPLSFGDEKVAGGEAGIKARLLDRRLNLNVAAYRYHYSGLQVGSIEITPSGVLALRTINAASANTTGVEVDSVYAPPTMEGLILRAGVSYNHARYDSFANAPCGNNQTISQGCNRLIDPVTGRFNAQDLSGKRLARAPEWSLNGGFDYEVPVGRDLAVSVGGSVTYVSAYLSNFLGIPGFTQRAYAKANLNVALKGPNEAWELALIGKNITDMVTAGYCANSNGNGALILGGQVSGAAQGGPAGDDYAACFGDRGREVWLRLTVRPLELMQ
jgi:iron complex outermembrane receptor protein